jgi:hypothetical protein
VKKETLSCEKWNSSMKKEQKKEQKMELICLVRLFLASLPLILRLSNKPIDRNKRNSNQRNSTRPTQLHARYKPSSLATHLSNATSAIP